MAAEGPPPFVEAAEGRLPLWLCSYVAMKLCGDVAIWLCGYVVEAAMNTKNTFHGVQAAFWLCVAGL